MLQRKSKRGRRAGALKKAHDGVKETAEHIELAAHGNFAPDVQRVAYGLAMLAAQREGIFSAPRQWLEQNKTLRRSFTLPLPDGEHFNAEEIAWLRETGLDAQWTLQTMDLEDTPLTMLSRLLDAAQNPDASFFRELARRFESNQPKLNSPVESTISFLAQLKRALETPTLRRLVYKQHPTLKGAHKGGVTTTQNRADRPLPAPSANRPDHNKGF